MSEDDETLLHLTAWAQARPGVHAAILTSTRAGAQAPVDRFSDYDVILVVDDIQPFFGDRTWLEEFGHVLVLYRDPILPEHGLGRFAYITQYEGGLKIDFTVWPVELLRRVAAGTALPDDLDVGYQVLYDETGLAAALAPPTHTAHIPSPPDEATYDTLVEEFFHEATYVAKHLWRDDLLPAKYNLDQAMKQVNLRRMLEWYVEIGHDWSVKPGAYGKGLKRRVSPDIWTELERTYVGTDIEENWEALFRTIALFRRVAVDVGERLGYDYPFDLDRRVVAYLESVRSLESGPDSVDPILSP
jgi:aminoglycoside 6-adenylyltransferase